MATLPSPQGVSLRGWDTCRRGVAGGRVPHAHGSSGRRGAQRTQTRRAQGAPDPPPGRGSWHFVPVASCTKCQLPRSSGGTAAPLASVSVGPRRAASRLPSGCKVHRRCSGPSIHLTEGPLADGGEGVRTHRPERPAVPPRRVRAHARRAIAAVPRMEQALKTRRRAGLARAGPIDLQRLREVLPSGPPRPPGGRLDPGAGRGRGHAGRR